MRMGHEKICPTYPAHQTPEQLKPTRSLLFEKLFGKIMKKKKLIPMFLLNGLIIFL